MENDADTKALIDALLDEIAALKQEVAELRRRLDLDSDTSSKPPSSDGLKKKPRANKPRSESLRGKSGKKSGGQKGHKGNNLRQIDEPDKSEHHKVCTCEHCQAQLGTNDVVGSQKRQVFDIPKPKLEVTEHRADISKCPDCDQVTRAQFPAGVNAPTQYGERIKSAAVYFNVQQLIPEDRCAAIMTDLLGAPSLCPASIASWVNKKADEFAPVIEAIKQRLKQSYARHLDETGFRIGGKTQWLHTVSSSTLTYYLATEKRGDIPIFLQESKSGVIVHDHFKPYYKKLTNLRHALCNAHHLRELKALIKYEKEEWAREMYELLVAINSLKRQAVKKASYALAPPILRCFHELYDNLVQTGLAFHRSLRPLEKKANRGRKKRRPGHNLLRRLRDFKEDVLRFVEDFAVPFTNNLAERDIRMMKVRMKISGGFRSAKGAQVFVVVRSLISTARKQGSNILKTLSAKPDSLIHELNITG